MFVSETYEIQDCIKEGFNGWTGVTTGTDTYPYVTAQSGHKVVPNVSLPANFKMTYKFKDMRTTEDSSGTWLWYIGADSSNGVLIGSEDSDRRIRIYNRSGGSNTVIGTENYVFTKQQWTDAEITLNNGTITVSVGGKSLSHSLSSRTVFETWGSNYTNCRIAEFKIKPL